MTKPLDAKHKARTDARKNARRFAVQGLYAWLMTGNSIAQIEDDLLANLKIEEEPIEPGKYVFLEHDVDLPLDQDLFKLFLHQVPLYKNQCDELLLPHLSRSIEELTLIEHVILLIGAYELLERPEVPYKVVINEGIELAKQFGAQDSHKFINGVLDKLAKQLRS